MAPRLAGFDLDSAGAVALADSSNGVVRVFSSDGRMRFALGRKGSGVGEFIDPRFPRFRGDGTIHIADAANARVTVFSPEGALLRSVQLRPLLSLSGFIPLDDGRYLVTSDDPDGYVLFLFDSGGELLDRFLPIRDPRAAGLGARSLSRLHRQFWLAQRGDSAFVVSDASDSLWVVGLTDRSTGAVAITPPRFPPLGQHPDASTGQLREPGMPGVAAGIEAGHAGLIVNFNAWRRDGSERGTAVVLTLGGRWMALENASALLCSGLDAFATLSRAADGTGRLMLRRYRLLAH